MGSSMQSQCNQIQALNGSCLAKFELERVNRQTRKVQPLGVLATARPTFRRLP